MPSVLGLRDLAPLIDATAGAASPSFDLAGATALARVFSPTRAFDRARAVVGRHRFVVLTGPPEMGKTAIARMIGLAKLTDGWEVHECTNPDQVWRAYDPRRRQLFVADDAFGSTEYRPDAAERWAEHLARLLRALDDHHWLIWTSRPAPLKAGLRRVQRERGSERFPAPAEILVDAGDLDLAEKTLILFRHAKAHGVDGGTRRLVRTSAVAIVEHPHFTPERIRRFVADRLDALAEAGDTAGVAAAVERELQAPTAAMTASFAALEPEHRDLLIALLDAPAGLVDDRELAAAVRRHHRGGLTHPPAELIDRLTDHFLKLTPLGIGWIHPSWRDLVIDELRADAAARQAFLGAAGIDGVLLVLSTAGGAGGERGLPLLVADADWDLCTDRIVELIRRLEDKDVARLLLALDDVSRVELPPAQQREAAGLAASALAAARRTWDARGRPLPVFLLERWYQLNAGPGVTAPQLSLTWAELHPAPDATAPADRSELERADDWLALAALLAEHDPAANSRFGFPLREQRTLARLIDAAAGPAAAGDEAAASVLRRIQTLVRSGALDALAAAAASAPRPATEPQHDWWVPADLDVPPSDEPAAAAAARFRREDVARVLRDL
jgi:hypothetical protein